MGRYPIFVVLLVLSVGLASTFYIFLTQQPDQDKYASLPEVTGIIDMKKNVFPHYPKSIPPPNSLRWEKSKHLFTLFQELYSKDSSVIKALRNRCDQLTEWEKLRDLECHADWIYRLKHDKIVAIDQMLGFEMGKRNAFRVVFESGIYGWYKTCPGGGEEPEMEVVGYVINHILGFNMMAPAVSRELNIKELESLVSHNSTFLEYVAQTDYLCSSGRGVFPGVMIGWWNNLEETSSLLPKKKANPDDAIKLRDNWVDIQKKYPVEEMPRNHAFLYLLTILQHQGHNEFRVKNGPLVVIDVDRGFFRFNSPTKGFSLKYLCKIDLQTYEALVDVSGVGLDSNTLGIMVWNTLQLFSPTTKFSTSEIGVLHERLGGLLTMIDSCVEQYGKDSVFYELDPSLL